MKAISIRAEDSTIALKMRKNARNNEINSITKIVAMISFVCFNESRIKRIMIRRMTEAVIIVIKKHFIKNCFKLKQKNS